MMSKSFLIVGEGIWPWYMGATADALRRLGYSVEEFSWASVFKEWTEGDVEPQHKSLSHRVQERLGAGPLVGKINRSLLKTAGMTCPEFVLFYNVRLITPRTMRRLRLLLPNSVFGQFANDNPFSERASFGYWRNFLRSIPYFDLHFAYRLENLEDYKAHGCKNVHLLRSYFIPEVDRPIPSDELSQADVSDVVCAGHFEADGRLEALTALVQSGISLRLFGGGWEPVLKGLPESHPLRSQLPARPVVGHDYRRTLAGAKIALCFLSTMNKDTYTRRNFEIPAIGTAVLSQYSDDLASLFRENEEIAFFSDTATLIKRAQELLHDVPLRKRIADGGSARVRTDGHDVDARMRGLAQAFESAGR